MKLFLIDTENVSDYKSLIPHINIEDEIIFCCTSKSKTISIDCLKDLYNSRGMLSFLDFYNGSPNALDFQMVSLLTEKVILNEYDEYYIYSNDTGFDVACRYLSDKYIRVIDRIGTNVISNESIEFELSPVDEKDSLSRKLIDLVNSTNNLSRDRLSLEVNKIRFKYSKSDIHNELVKIYGKDMGSKLYKSCFKNGIKNS